ncbi:hypothetical protein DL98DRAFT_272252 [Cadophora sp. DSE1049]|nr:hypothetical protein DL98DRAFT_272252 [Cadophora sp. DSE1049]
MILPGIHFWAVPFRHGTASTVTSLTARLLIVAQVRVLIAFVRSILLISTDDETIVRLVRSDITLIIVPWSKFLSYFNMTSTFLFSCLSRRSALQPFPISPFNFQEIRSPFRLVFPSPSPKSSVLVGFSNFKTFEFAKPLYGWEHSVCGSNCCYGSLGLLEGLHLPRSLRKGSCLGLISQSTYHTLP